MAERDRRGVEYGLLYNLHRNERNKSRWFQTGYLYNYLKSVAP